MEQKSVKTGYVTLYEHVYEGGLGVFWMEGPHGTWVVAIPRLRLSVPLMRDASDHSHIVYVLMQKGNWRREAAEELAQLILNEMERGK